MKLTLCCLCLVVGSVWLAGIPLAWLLRGRRHLRAQDVLQAPFLGIAGIVLVLQNLVYLNVPISLSAPFFWVGLALAWFLFWRSGQMKGSIRNCPWGVVAAATVVYLVQASALLVEGADWYVGRGWSDCFNYTVLAQFVADFPFRTSWADLGHHPFLVSALFLKDDRIGQSIMHGFLAASSGRDASAFFGPLIVLSPALTVLSIVLLGRRLGLRRRPALLAGVAAGLLPGLTGLHLEGFLSHALAEPMVFAFLAVLYDLIAYGGRARLARAALILATITSLYTELWPILQALTVLAAMLAWSGAWQQRAVLLRVAVLSAAPVVLNPGFAIGLIQILGRVTMVALANIYPWAYSIEGLSRLWAGDLAVSRHAALKTAARAVGLAATALGYLGLCKGWIDRWRGRRGSPRYILAGCVLALAVLPLAIFAGDENHPYQFYKLLLSVSPLLVLGLASLWEGPTRTWGELVPASILRRILHPGVLSLATLTVVLLTAAAGTAHLLRGAVADQPHPRSGVQYWRTEDMRDLQAQLRSLPPGKLVIALGSGDNPAQNSWLSYFARRQDVVLASPEVIDMHLTSEPPESAPAALGKPTLMPSGRVVHVRPAADALSVEALPAEILVLQRKVVAFAEIHAGDLTAFWSGPWFTLSKSNTGRWGLPLGFNNPFGCEVGAAAGLSWLGPDGASLEILAGRPGRVTLTATLIPGPCATHGSGPPRLVLHTLEGRQLEAVPADGERSLTFAVPAGKTTVRLAPADAGTAPPAGGDPRTLLIGIQGLTFAYTCDEGP